MNPKPEACYQDALTCLKALEDEGYQARLAGGCVRDRYLGITPKDYDIATTARPEATRQVFQKRQRRVVATGEDHGTLTIVMPHSAIEVTTLRRDVKTDGRRAQVVFGDSFEEDAARRDFTMNALFEDLQGQIYDFYGGRNHLAAGVIRFVGDARQRVQEDYLRILRLFRFWGRLGFAPDTQELSAIAGEAQGLRRISQERISSELLGIVTSPKAPPAVRAMQELGILAEVLPGYAASGPLMFVTNPYPEYPSHLSQAFGLSQLLASPIGSQELAAAAKGLKLANQLQRSLQAMRYWQCHTLPDLAATPAEHMEHLDRLEQLCGQRTGLGKLFNLWQHLWPQDTQALRAHWQELEATAGRRRRRPLPLDGHAIGSLTGISGRELGEVMTELKRAFRNGAFTDAAGCQQYLQDSGKLIAKHTES